MAAELKGITIGSVEKRREAYRAAVDMENVLPSGTANARAFRGILRRGFEQWVYRMLFLQPAVFLDHSLPDTVLRSDIEVAGDYGLSTPKGIQAKQEHIGAARTARIRRAIEHLEQGWPESDCIGFVCARDEWREALQKADRRENT